MEYWETLFNVGGVSGILGNSFQWGKGLVEYREALFNGGGVGGVWRNIFQVGEGLVEYWETLFNGGRGWWSIGKLF